MQLVLETILPVQAALKDRFSQANLMLILINCSVELSQTTGHWFCLILLEWDECILAPGKRIQMIFELLRLNRGVTDSDFISIYPEAIKHLDRKHWTPVSIAKVASEFLVERPGTKVLDIGSGAGKFCLIGAANTKGHFTGVEQRLELVELSQRLSAYYYIRNARFVHANIQSVDFSGYDAFYFYNSFYENLNPGERIDDAVRLSSDLYHLYSLHIAEQLAGCRPGTRLVTYCSPTTIVPRSFKLQDSLNGGLLKFWEKTYSTEGR